MKLITLTIFLMMSAVIQSFSQTANWAYNIGGDDWDENRAVAIDSLGYTYVIGYFESDSIYFNNGISLLNGGGGNSFLAKYNPSGVCQWAIRIGGTAWDVAQTISVQNPNNIFVGGYFSSAYLAFENSDTLWNYGEDDAYFARFNYYGECTGSSSIGGIDDDYIYSIKSDNAGNILVGGYFYSQYLMVNGVNIDSLSNGYDAFFAIFNSTFDYQWSQSIKGSDDDALSIITIDNLGNIWVAGNTWSDTLSFNNGYTIENYGQRDGYFAKYNSSGVCQFATNIGGNAYDGISGMVVDASNNVYTTGDYSSALCNFGSGTINYNIGGSDIYLAKYNNVGEALWNKRIAGNGWEEASGIAVYQNKYVFLTGYYLSDALSYDGYTTINNFAEFDAFVCKFRTDGKAVWGVNLAGDYYDFTRGIVADTNRAVIVVGDYDSAELNFDDNIYATNAGYNDGFVGKINDNSAPIFLVNNYYQNVGYDSIFVESDFIDDGDLPIIERGICWGLAENPTFVDNKINEGNGIGYVYSTISGLLANTTYHFRAYTITVNDTIYSADAYLTTMPEPLSTPTLISPTYNEQEININVQFKWNSVNYATSYIFQISMDENFSNFVETYYDILDTTIANLNLSYNTEYFWKVRATRSNDTSDWSSVWKFKTEEGIIVQNISLESGWNMTALGVEPTNNSIASIITPIATELIQVKNCNGQVYMPPFFNTLNEWNTSSAYKIKMSNAMQMPTTGLRIKPELHPIGFADVGWYWVPYFRTSSMQPDTALASLGGSYSQIKSISGLVYYPPYLNTLNLLQPNTGYMLRIIQSGILTYPAND